MPREYASEENARVADLLDEIGDLLELKGENTFKIRAYTGAALVTSSPNSIPAARQQSLISPEPRQSRGRATSPSRGRMPTRPRKWQWA